MTPATRSVPMKMGGGYAGGSGSGTSFDSPFCVPNQSAPSRSRKATVTKSSASPSASV